MSKPSPKLRRSKPDRGSAIVEFVMLGIPATLIFLGTAAQFVNGYVDTVARAIAIDVSRYAALADTDISEARSYGAAKLREQLGRVTTNFQVDYLDKKVSIVRLEYFPPLPIFGINAKAVPVQVVTPLEISK